MAMALLVPVIISLGTIKYARPTGRTVEQGQVNSRLVLDK